MKDESEIICIFSGIKNREYKRIVEPHIQVQRIWMLKNLHARYIKYLNYIWDQLFASKCYLYIKLLYTRCLNVVFSVHYLCCTRSDGHRWLKTSSRSIGNVKKSWSKKAAHGSTNIWSSGKYLDWLPLSLEVGVRPTFSHFLEKLTISWFHKYKIVTSRSDVIEKMTFKRTFSWLYNAKMAIPLSSYFEKIQNLVI